MKLKPTILILAFVLFAAACSGGSDSEQAADRIIDVPPPLAATAEPADFGDKEAEFGRAEDIGLYMGAFSTSPEVKLVMFENAFAVKAVPTDVSTVGPTVATAQKTTTPKPPAETTTRPPVVTQAPTTRAPVTTPAPATTARRTTTTRYVPPPTKAPTTTRSPTTYYTHTYL